MVWDLDGTLVETRYANLMAYKSLGIKPPEDFNVRPWQEWCTKEAHDAKGRIIKNFILNYAKPLQLLDVWQANGRGVILTNASHEAVDAIRERFGVLATADIWIGMNSQEKVRWLAAQPRHGIYFDDSQKTINLVKEHTKWHTVLVR